MRPRVLLLTSVGFQPAFQGDAARLDRLIRELRRNDMVVGVLNCHDEEQTGGTDYPSMRSRCDWLAWHHPLPNDRPPLQGIDAWCPDSFLSHAETAVTAFQPDVLIAQFASLSRCLEPFASHDSLLKILDADNIFHLRRQRFMDAGIDEHWVNCTVADEQRAWQRADIILAIQEIELQRIRELLPFTPVLLVPPGKPPVFHPLPAGKQVLFVGADNAANTQGLLRFLEYGWPQLSACHPEAELVIAGAVCQRLPALPSGVRLLHLAPDLSREYRRATLVINCVETASGISIKTIDALCEGKCLITYPAGASGLENHPGILIRVDSPQGMAQRASQLLNAPDEIRQIARTAFRFSCDHLAPATAMASLVDTIRCWATLPESLRCNRSWRSAWLDRQRLAQQGIPG